MELDEVLNKINEIASIKYRENEIIEDIDMIKVSYYLNNMKIEKVGDVLIFLAALNVCNTYVKQEEHMIGYYFKKGIIKLINFLNKNYIQDISIKIESDGLYMFMIKNTQFSFHNVEEVEVNERYLKDFKWDEIKKQACAKSVFNLAILNTSVCNKDFNGNNLTDGLNKRINEYKLHKNLLHKFVRLEF